VLLLFKKEINLLAEVMRIAAAKLNTEDRQALDVRRYTSPSLYPRRARPALMEN